MKIKLDENLPLFLATRLKNLGHDVHTTNAEQLIGRTDCEIWEAAQRESRFLSTQDLDFSDSRQFAPGSHCGILLVRPRSPNRRTLIERVEGLFKNEDVGSWAGCFIVATDRKIRVMKPRGKDNR